MVRFLRNSCVPYRTNLSLSVKHILNYTKIQDRKGLNACVVCIEYRQDLALVRRLGVGLLSVRGDVVVLRESQ